MIQTLQLWHHSQATFKIKVWFILFNKRKFKYNSSVVVKHKNRNIQIIWSDCLAVSSELQVCFTIVTDGNMRVLVGFELL